MRGMQRISTAGIARRGSKYLLALRKPGTSIGESWEFPGGKARFGEPPEEALKREFFEEFQIHILVGRMIFMVPSQIVVPIMSYRPLISKFLGMVLPLQNIRKSVGSPSMK